MHGMRGRHDKVIAHNVGTRLGFLQRSHLPPRTIPHPAHALLPCLNGRHAIPQVMDLSSEAHARIYLNELGVLRLLEEANNGFRGARSSCSNSPLWRQRETLLRCRSPPPPLRLPTGKPVVRAAVRQERDGGVAMPTMWPC